MKALVLGRHGTLGAFEGSRDDDLKGTKPVAFIIPKPVQPPPRVHGSALEDAHLATPAV